MSEDLRSRRDGIYREALAVDWIEPVIVAAAHIAEGCNRALGNGLPADGAHRIYGRALNFKSDHGWIFCHKPQ
jgi:hypothetical protein